MKGFTVALTSWAGLFALVQANGSRGAMERAALFSLYLAEEIFEDPSKRTVAVGCVGTRPNLLYPDKDPKRCNLKEFVDHIWHSTEDAEGKVIDPNHPKTLNPVFQDELKTTADYGTMNADKFKTYIENVKVGDKMIPKPGYTGWINAGNVFQGETSYYNMILRIADSKIASRAEYDRRYELDNNDKKIWKFELWNNEVDRAIGMTADLRVADANRNLLNSKNGLANKEYFGYPVGAREKVKSTVPGSSLVSWREFDYEKTLKMYENDKDKFPGGREEVEKKLGEALAKVNSLPITIDHQLALNNMRETYGKMTTAGGGGSDSDC